MASALAAAGKDISLFDRIGALLARHDLDPSPAHYALCHRYLAGEDDLFAAAVDHVIARFGGLTPDAVAALPDGQEQPIEPEELQAMADEAQSYLERVTGIVAESGRDVRAYNAALSGKANALVPGRAPDPVIEGLVTLTRAMIDKSRDAGEHLRRTGDEISALRDKLVEARANANSDALTGLPNRRALDVRMAQACLDARAKRTPLSVAICDIDHFKLVNDVHGHQVGDEVIKLVANALGVGGGDAFVSRYGGEEFVVLFEETSVEAAAVKVDRIRQDIATRDIKVTATGRRLGRVSFSAGVAELRGRSGGSGMLKRADAALYRAKAAGRDQVLVAED